MMGPASYCLGFAFNCPQPEPNTPWDKNAQVALIRKIKPTWQAGRLNGIGGMIEDFDRGEGASRAGLNAMVREFREETGYETERSDWNYFHTMGSEEWQVECYRSFNVPLHQLKTTTEETVEFAYVDFLPRSVLFNLHWLIPLALDPQPLPTMQVYR